MARQSTDRAESRGRGAGAAFAWDDDLLYLREDALVIRRERSGRGFRYANAAGAPVRDAGVLSRIRALAIPPAWTEVRIAADPRGHLQAIGRDARGRRQYVYHPEWRRRQQLDKFGRLLAFGEVLPDLRERVDADMAERGLTRRRVLATVVRLLDRTFLRIGNREYLRHNGSFGLTTLREKHVDLRGSRACFEFEGKSGVRQRACVSDRRVAATLRRCIELPGYEIFQYVDEEGRRRLVDSQDVNAYLKEAAGDSFTAKDFRTWGGSVTAGQLLFEAGGFTTAREARRNVTRVVCRVARMLGNTPAVCRSYYVHPSVPHTYREGLLVPHFARCRDGYDPGRCRLSCEEHAAWTLVREHPAPA